MLQSLLPLDFSFAVAKGRRRYACTARLMAAGTAAGQQDLLPDESRDEHSGLQGAGSQRQPRRHGGDAAPPAQGSSSALAESFEAGRWNGDRDELAVPVADELWAGLTTDRQGCSGNRCPDFARCPFQAARQRAKEADLVIANHDLVLSALDMEAGSVLPPASETFYVFRRGAQPVGQGGGALRGPTRPARGQGNGCRVPPTRCATPFWPCAWMTGCCVMPVIRPRCIDEALGELYRLIHATRAFEVKRARRFRSGELPEWVLRHGGVLHSAASELQKTFAVLREAVLQRAPIEGSLATQVLSALGFFAAKLDNLVETLAPECWPRTSKVSAGGPVDRAARRHGLVERLPGLCITDQWQRQVAPPALEPGQRRDPDVGDADFLRHVSTSSSSSPACRSTRPCSSCAWSRRSTTVRTRQAASFLRCARILAMPGGTRTRLSSACPVSFRRSVRWCCSRRASRCARSMRCCRRTCGAAP